MTEADSMTGAQSVHSSFESIMNIGLLDPVAPAKYQKLLSYTVGYLCVLGWHASLAGTCYASGQQIQAILVLANPSYTIQTWQTALLAWAIVILAILFNTVLFRRLPIIEGCVMILHVFGFFAFIIVLWYVFYL